ncbi:hypothetical protein [Gordonia sp. MP11Mi]|uniref:Uncharacterized protein n=1 Tax=Gordonia sp. MP11Mi TaxID=3022769 RepID=A0AA97GVA3_9ACTN
MDRSDDIESVTVSLMRGAHAVVAGFSPWAVIAVFVVVSRGASTHADEIDLLRTSGYATTGICAVLLISTLVLRRSRPSAAVSYPFAVFWSVIGLLAALIAGRMTLHGMCGDELQLCMPGLLVLNVGVPVALCVTSSVLGSAAVDWNRQR